MEKTKGARSMCAPLFFISALKTAGTYQIIPLESDRCARQKGGSYQKIIRSRPL